MADDIDVLIAALDDPDPNVRLQVAEALGDIPDPRVVAPLIRVLHDKGMLRSTAATGLRNLGALALPALLAVVQNADEDRTVRLWAISAVGEIGDAAAVAPLAVALTDPQPPIRYAAAFALGRLSSPASVAPLTAVATDPDESVRYAAAIALDNLRR